MSIGESSVDAVITDPPYGLKFMGKGWDDIGHGSEQQAWHYRWAVEALRVLKPGGHLLAFGGTRTYHRLASAVEDAGFEIRDQMQWLYGTGFPKSHNIGKAIDKAAGAENIIGTIPDRWTGKGSVLNFATDREQAEVKVTAPSTPEAHQWEGWGTALKPANEPIVVARKPFKGTVAGTVLDWGTGGVNVDGCRIESAQERPKREVHALREDVEYSGAALEGRLDGSLQSSKAVGTTTLGRWPANIILDEEAGRMLDEQAGETGNNWKKNYGDQYADEKRQYKGGSFGGGGYGGANTYMDKGGPSRYFYCPKVTKKEREAGLVPGEGQTRANAHPTVKPVNLMAYLIRLVTPPNGLILDPFVGSGTTGIAAVREGFRFVGIEIDDGFVELSKNRIRHEAKEGDQR